MSTKSFLILCFILSYLQLYAQNENIRSFTTGAFEVTNPQKAIIEVGINTSEYGSLYLDWLYSLNENITINFDIRPIDDFGEYIVFLSSSFNLFNNFSVGPYISFYHPRIGLFGSYRIKIIDLNIDTKVGGDFFIYAPHFQVGEFNYFLSLSLKERVSKNFQLIGEIYYDTNSRSFNYDDKLLLFSFGSQYELVNSINIRAMIGYSPLSNRGNGNKIEAEIGVSYIFK